MMVARVWRKHGLKPHRIERYMASNDPDFERKVMARARTARSMRGRNGAGDENFTLTVRQNRLPYAAGQGLAGAAAPIRETSRWPMTRTAPAQPIYFAVIEGISNFEDVTPSGNGPSSLLIVEGRFVLIFQLPLTFL